MNETLVSQFGFSDQEIQNIMHQALSGAMQSMSQQKAPSWLEALLSFINIHPWLTLLIVFAVLLLITAIIREIICSYLKTNEILVRLKKIEEKL